MAKNFLQVILKQLTEKPKWTFWPTRYLQHKFSAGGYLPHSPTTTSEDSWRCLDSLLSWLNGEYYWNPVGRDHEWCEASHLTKDSSQPTNNYVPQNISTVRLRNSDVEGPSKALRSVGNWLKKKKIGFIQYHLHMHWWYLSFLPLRILTKLNSFWALPLR